MKINSLMIYSLLLFLTSCSVEPEQESFVNITDQYELKLHQTLSPSGGVPSLHFTSIETYDCTNSYISHTAIISEEKTRIYLNEILTEGICISGNILVTENILVNTSNTALPVQISVKNIIHNEGTLHSNNSEFDLILKGFDGLKINKTHINRIQPKMIWGSYSTSNDEIAALLKNFITNVNLDQPKLTGDYGLFYVAQNNSVSIYDDEKDFTFLISTESDFNNFTSKILEFKELDSSLVFQATNYDGSALNIH